MQFANVSPIVNNETGGKQQLSNTTVANLKDIQSFSNISVPYEITGSESSDFTQHRWNTNCNDKSSRLVGGRLNGHGEEEADDEDGSRRRLSSLSSSSTSSSSNSLIEGRLSCRLSFDQATTVKTSTTAGKSLRRKSTASSNVNNQLTTVSPLSNASSGKTAASSTGNDSLLSFEHHELSQAVDNRSRRSDCETTGVGDGSMLQYNVNAEKLKLLKEKFNSQSPLFNSTPLVFPNTHARFQSGFSANEETQNDSTIMFANAEQV
jgi:hypothetical protein